MKNYLVLLSLIALCLLILSACAPGVSNKTDKDPAGFFLGFWHGLITPVTLIWQLFNHSVRIYEVHNTGWAYDAGFFLAIMCGYGGMAYRRNRH